MTTRPPQVGAPDPEMRTSPIAGQSSEYGDDDTPPDLEALETPVCYFNNESFPIGSYVLSGDELLSCERPGLWVRKGEQRPSKDDVGA